MYTWGYIKDCILSKLDLSEEEATVQNLLNRFPYYANEVITQISSAIKPKPCFETITILESELKLGPIIKQIQDPNFIAFGKDTNLITYLDAYTNKNICREAYDTDFLYRGYKELMFINPGIYNISYDARWITFTSAISDTCDLNVPLDILDCIPPYVVSQCLKIDDEKSSAIFRNEYEMALARIDNTNYATPKTIRVGGDW